jgi:hypothetical protein
MWKKSVDIALRAALLVSVAAFDVAPAAASIMPATSPAGATGTGNDDQLDLSEFAPLILAQSVDHPGGGDRGNTGGNDHTPSNDGRSAQQQNTLSSTMTRKIVLDLGSIRKECGHYDEAYRIDCLRQGIEMLAASLPDNSDYRDVKRILKKAGGRLGRIVETYQDSSKPKLDAPANANPRFRTRRHYTAIRRAAEPEAMAQAKKVIDEAATQLLRSSENSERRYAHYQQISAAVDSTKVLLRSS